MWQAKALEPGEEASRWFYCQDCGRKILIVGYTDIMEFGGLCEDCEADEFCNCGTPLRTEHEQDWGKCESCMED